MSLRRQDEPLRSRSCSRKRGPDLAQRPFRGQKL